MENATDTELKTLLANTREFIAQAWADGATNTALREEKKAALIEGEISRRSLAAYWAGSVSQSIANDVAAGNVVTINI